MLKNDHLNLVYSNKDQIIPINGMLKNAKPFIHGKKEDQIIPINGMLKNYQIRECSSASIK